jgi:RNA-directed DNA polymerase
VDIQEGAPLSGVKEVISKRKNLIRLGGKKGVAYAWSRTRMRGWTLAQSPILGTVIKVLLLKSKGYVSMIDYFSKFKVSI